MNHSLVPRPPCFRSSICVQTFPFLFWMPTENENEETWERGYMNQCTHITLSATSSAGREVGKIVGSAHWLKQCRGTVAAMVAGGGENIITNISARGKRVMVINQQLHNGCFSQLQQYGFLINYVLLCSLVAEEVIHICRGKWRKLSSCNNDCKVIWTDSLVFFHIQLRQKRLEASN